MLRIAGGFLCVLTFFVATTASVLGQASDPFDELIKLKLHQLHPDSTMAEWQWTFRLAEGEIDSVPRGTLRKYSDNLTPNVSVDISKGEEVTPELIEKAKAYSEVQLGFVLDDVGQELSLACIQLSNRVFLKQYCARERILDPSFLSVPAFVDKMNLSLSQRSKLDEINSSFQAHKEEMTSSLLDEVHQINAEKMKEILKCVTVDRRKLIKDLVGVPIDWARLELYAGKNLLQRVRECSVDNEKLFAMRLPDMLKAEAKQIRLMSRKELEDNQIKHFDIMLYSLLSSKFFQHQLDFTDDQRAEVAKYLRSVRKSSVLSGKFRATRFIELLEENAKFPSELEELLIPEQVNFLRQAELQFYSGTERSSFGLLHPKVIASLRFDASKAREIETVVNKYEEKLRETKVAIQEKLREIGIVYARKRIKVFKPTDQKRFKLLTGEDSEDLDVVFERILQKRGEKPKTFEYGVKRFAPSTL